MTAETKTNEPEYEPKSESILWFLLYNNKFTVIVVPFLFICGLIFINIRFFLSIYAIGLAYLGYGVLLLYNYNSESEYRHLRNHYASNTYGPTKMQERPYIIGSAAFWITKGIIVLIVAMISEYLVYVAKNQ